MMIERDGSLVASTYVEKQGGAYIYLDTYRRDDGTEYEQRNVSIWSPEQINKLRSTIPGSGNGVMIDGFGVAEEMPSVKYVKKGKSLT